MRNLAVCVLWAAAIAVVAALTGLRAGGPSEGRADHLPSPPERTYVVVIDGLRPHEVNPLLMPNLTALREESTWYQQARAVFPAETLPNHAAMMTGVTGKRSGIVGNYFLNEHSSSRVERIYQNDPKMLRVETLITRLERACGPAVSTASVLSKQYLFELFGTGPSAGTPPPRDPDSGQVVADHHWQPRPIIPVSEHAPDASTMQTGFLPWMRTAPTPQFGFVNLGDVDRAGHADAAGAYGEGRDAFHQSAIRATDQLLGDFVTELKQKGWWDETALVVLSDHGMDWSLPDHRISSLEAMEGGDGGTTGQRAFVANNGSADMIYVKGHDPAVRDRIAEAMKRLTVSTVMDGGPKDKLAVERLLTDREGLDAANEHPRRLYGLDTTRAGDIIALAKPGWRFSLSDSSNPIPGNHGHTVTQHATLLVTGGHPLLSTAGPGSTEKQSVPGATVWKPGDENAPPARPPLPPQGGPGTMSVTPTLAPLLGLPPLPGGYDGQPLTEAFDAGALRNAKGICEGLGNSETDPTPPEDPNGGPTDGPTGGPTDPDGGRTGTPVVGSAATSLTASRSRVGYRKPFALSGRVDRSPDCEAPQWIEIRRRPSGARSFAEFVEVPINRDGSWRTELTAGSNATYVAIPDTLRCATSLSPPRTVRVAARLDLLPRAGCAVRGRVIPAHPGTRVFLQRRQGRRWKRVRKARLNQASRFRMRIPRCADGRYRVVWPGQEGNARTTRKFRL